VAYRLNGQDLPLKRGSPVRMVVPWAHGFKSIKWLQKIVLTNEYQPTFRTSRVEYLPISIRCQAAILDQVS
jgi:DMSO/TMAO reductase YedYZ molybdopterin-dependent catalytic subunit